MDVRSINVFPHSSGTPLAPTLTRPAHTLGVWIALGWIVLYFALQAVGGGLIGVALAIATGFINSWQDLTHIRNVHAALEQPGMQALLVILTLGLAASVMLLMTRHRWPHLWSQGRPPGFGFVRPAQLGYLLLAVVIGLAAPLVGAWLTRLLAHGHPVTQNIQQLGEHTPLAWRIPLVLLVVSLGPLVEELLFRGVLLSALLQRWGATTAVLLSSMAFALAHLQGLDWQAFALPDLLLLALALAWLRLRSNSIWPGVIAHGTNNALAVAAWFVATHHGG
ncbi:MAG: CPBP family intramembrane glutamic endopeptidase [Rhodanobacter sp.]